MSPTYCSAYLCPNQFERNLLGWGELFRDTEVSSLEVCDLCTTVAVAGSGHQDFQTGIFLCPAWGYQELNLDPSIFRSVLLNYDPSSVQNPLCGISGAVGEVAFLKPWELLHYWKPY